VLCNAPQLARRSAHDNNKLRDLNKSTRIPLR
jgi:hypothetical protein